MRFFAKSICLSVLAGLTACSGYVEDKASVDFAPVYPEATTSRSGPPTGSIYHSGASGIFAVDRRASQVGDILTINLNESFAATKNQTSVADRSDTMTLQLPLNMTDAISEKGLSAGSSQKFSGSGDAKQSNNITGFVTVSVVRVFPNGHLEVLGQKKLTLSQGDEYIRIKGMVRPADISPSNVVNSDRLANAEITYIGTGDISDANKRGWLARVLTKALPI